MIRVRMFPGLGGLDRSAEMTAGMAQVADKLAAAGNGSAEVSNMSPGAPFSGGPGVPGEGKLSTSDPGWHFIEYGTMYAPPRAAIRGVVEGAGLEFKD